jgi:hypothetical protein
MSFARCFFAPLLPQDDVVMRATIVHAAQSVEALPRACRTLQKLHIATKMSFQAQRQRASNNDRASLRHKWHAAISPARRAACLRARASHARSLQLLPERGGGQRQRCAGESGALALGLPAMMLLIPNRSGM